MKLIRKFIRSVKKRLGRVTQRVLNQLQPDRQVPDKQVPDKQVPDKQVPDQEALEATCRELFHGHFSHSAAGEDRLVIAFLQTVFGFHDASKIRYCDVGASHPITLNNTFALYERGASGVLVEPDPDGIALLQKTRPRDIVLNVGAASDERRSAKLIRFTARVFNTFSEHQANKILKSSKNWGPDQLQKVVDEVTVELVPMNEILGRYFKDGLHFLSIDAEGLDFQIIQSIDFSQFKPLILCVEASHDQSELFDMVLRPHGYELIARTPDNIIYKAKQKV